MQKLLYLILILVGRKGDLRYVGPVSEPAAGHVTEHRAEGQAVGPLGEEQVGRLIKHLGREEI